MYKIMLLHKYANLRFKVTKDRLSTYIWSNNSLLVSDLAHISLQSANIYGYYCEQNFYF